ncbi:unnamed protein product [Echinostoma caproni]|uniref:Uncharacterized protein n=1 Tax=Echinostoma caproni TaxID=27848 RepID=A0A183B740_9TREM|nr:unnamed protein product [Echinostoma caproni]
MATARPAPARRLFVDQATQSGPRRHASVERKSELDQICRKSVERLRELFNFDLEHMEPVAPRWNNSCEFNACFTVSRTSGFARLLALGTDRVATQLRPGILSSKEVPFR